MGSIRGKIVEKGGVNISTVSGQFSEEMRQRIPGAKRILNTGQLELVL